MHPTIIHGIVLHQGILELLEGLSAQSQWLKRTLGCMVAGFMAQLVPMTQDKDQFIS